MGYRFTLDQINMVAHLVEGNINTVIEEMAYTYDNYLSNVEYIKDILFKFSENFYTTDRSYYRHKIGRAKELAQEIQSIEFENPVGMTL